MLRDMPSQEDAEIFSKKVDEVCMLVDGLSKGTLTPEYIDGRIERQEQKNAAQPAQVPSGIICMNYFLVV
jgi:hypothetical protein